MAWVNRCRVEDGSWRYTALYRDRAGLQRSAGTFRVRHEAERAGTAAEIRMVEGSWVDRQAGLSPSLSTSRPIYPMSSRSRAGPSGSER